MPTDANGTYTLPPSYFVQNGDPIQPVQHNPPLEDLQQGMTDRVMRDGRAAMTGDLNMDGHKVVGMVDGVGPNDAATVGQSIPPSRTVTAGSGLTGGGDLSANRTFNVGQGDGISVAADAVAVDSTVVRTTRAVATGDGLTGGGTLAANRTLAVDNTVVRTSRSVTAGNGLTGGGSLAADRSLNVGAGDGISVSADAVAVDSTVVRTTRSISAGDGLTGGGTLAANRSIAVDSSVVRTSGNQTISGTKNFTGSLLFDGNPVASVTNTSNVNDTSQPVGTTLNVFGASGSSRNSSRAVYLSGDDSRYTGASGGPQMAGTWRQRGYTSSDAHLFQRTV